MNIVPFEELKITTMTLVMALSKGINMELIYHLLPWVKIDMKPTRGASKYKLPHCKTPGSILSIRYKGQVRGAILSTSTPFKNAVSLYISTKKKNISVKLAPYSIQMCGASSRNDGLEAGNYLVNYIKEIQEKLMRWNKYPDLRDKLFDYIKLITKGNVIKRRTEETRNYTNISLRIYHENDDNEINQEINEEEVKRYCQENNLNYEDVKYLLMLKNDFMYYSDFCSKLNFIGKIYSVIEENGLLEIIEIKEAMVNYNYSLGFEVDRALLNEYMDGYDGFISRYNNALMTSVKIEVPYEPEGNVKRKRNKVPHHTFLVYKSGAVTQSGPGGRLMKEVYDNFMGYISQIYQLIQYKNI